MAFSLLGSLGRDMDRRHVENARLVATFLGIFGFAEALYLVATDNLPAGSAVLGTLNAVILVGFGYGFAHHSRLSAVLCVAYHAVTSLFVSNADDDLAGVAGLLIFGYFFVRGTIAVFALHTRSPAAAGEAGTHSTHRGERSV